MERQRQSPSLQGDHDEGTSEDVMEYDYDSIDIHLEAQSLFRQGKWLAAERIVEEVLAREEHASDDVYFSRLMQQQINGKVLSRNNIAICKHVTLQSGGCSAEVLFRLGLDEVLRLLTDEVFIQFAPDVVLRKLEYHLSILRCNLGLSWLINPVFSKSALDIIYFSLRNFSLNARLWLRTAEACIIFLSSKSEKGVLVWQPSDILASPLNETRNDYRNIELLRKYVPIIDEEVTWDFADQCISNAKRLIHFRPSHTPGFADSSNLETLSKQELKQVEFDILITAAYIASQCKNFSKVLRRIERLLRLSNLPENIRLLAITYKDLALFQLNQGNYSVFHPQRLQNDLTARNINGATNTKTKNINDVIELTSQLMLMRKYQELLALLNVQNFKETIQSLKDYVKRYKCDLPRPVIIFLLYAIQKLHFSAKRNSFGELASALHPLFLKYSDLYFEEYCKKRVGDRRFGPGILQPETSQSKAAWKVIDAGTRGLEESLLPIHSPLPSLKNTFSTVIRISHKRGERGVLIPL